MPQTESKQIAGIGALGVRRSGDGWWPRILLVMGILAYTACFQWMYIHYLYPEFGYFGFDYNRPGAGHLVLVWILSLVPSLWMPIRLTRPSQLAYWVLYITVFIPSMCVPLYAGLNPPAEISILMVTLFVGFALLGAGYFLPLLPIPSVKFPPHYFWWGFGCVVAGLAAWMLVVFRGHLQVVSFGDVYDLRQTADDLAEGSGVNYAFMLLTGAFNPFLMGYGLYCRRRWFFIAGALGQLLVYAIGGTKGSILSVLFVPLIYLLMRVIRFPFGLNLVSAALVLLGGASLSFFLVGYTPGPIHTYALFLILMRTLSTGGLVTAQYYDFFQRNPLTYLSHIKGVSLFVQYPYKYPIGVEVGSFYSGSTDLDATAHFWAFDGIGSFGLPGILFVSVICALVFWAIDSAARRHDPRLAALVVSYGAFNLANISMFTSLLSGGLGVLIVLLYVMPVENVRSSTKPHISAKARAIPPCGDETLPLPG